MQEPRIAKLNSLNGPNLTFDFHGCSEEDVQRSLNHALQNAYDMNTKQLRIITGRGNHVTSQGTSGTLYKNFPSYIEKSPYRDRVLKCEARDGHYIVHLKLKSNRTNLDYAAQQKLEQFMRLDVDYIKRQAEANNPLFMLEYAELLETGRFGVAQNFKAAAKLYLAAAAMHNPLAMHACARCYLEGMGVKQSDAKAVEWLKKGHEAGCLESTESLGRILYVGLPDYPADKSQGLKLLQEAIIKGSTNSMRFVANMYREQNLLQQEFELYQRAADLGDIMAQYNTAVAYHIGLGVTKDEAKAIHYFALAAKNGDPDSQCEYATRLLDKQPLTEADRAEAEKYLELAAENGSANACNLLAKIVNPKTTTRYLELSAQAGNIIDQLRLNAFNNKLEGPINKDTVTLAEVLPIFNRLVDNTLINLALDSKFLILDIVLLEGKAADKRRAFSIIQYMINQNCGISLRRLIYLHQRGDSCLQLAKSPEIVKQLQDRSALLGDIAAMCCMAKTLLPNSQLELRQSALTILNSLAKKHYPPACFELGLALEKNHGDVESLKKAIVYYKLAIDIEKNYNPEQHHYFGRIDRYEPISEKAQQRLAMLMPKILDAPSPPAVSPQISAKHQEQPAASRYAFFTHNISTIFSCALATAVGCYLLTK